MNQRRRISVTLESVGVLLFAALWLSPLLYALWAAFHERRFATDFDIFAPLTLDNFRTAFERAPFPRYMWNTVLYVGLVLVGQLILCSLAAYGLARYPFKGRSIVFGLVLLQLMITPEILIVRNYSTLSSLGLTDSVVGIGLPYIASAFGIFLLRQVFLSTPVELEEAAVLEGCGPLAVLSKVYVPLARPTYVAFALVSISHHWNNFLWPLIVSSSEESRPITVGLGLFGASESGVDWGLLSAATLVSIAPLAIAFILFQRQFMQSFARSGIK